MNEVNAREGKKSQWEGMGLSKVKGQEGYLLGVRLQQCARPGGFRALFQKISRVAPHRLGEQAPKGCKRRDWLRSSCHKCRNSEDWE